MAFYLSMAILFVIFDRFFKYMAVNYLTSDGVDLLGKIFRLNFTGNYDIAFSLPVNGGLLNILIIFIIVWLMYYLMYVAEKGRYSESLLLVFVILGASSNLMDRMQYGFVIDYLDLKYFTVFNLADAMIVLGAVGLAWANLQSDKNKKRI